MTLIDKNLPCQLTVASGTTERSFSVLRCLKNFARSTMKNDRLYSLGLMHIHRDFEVDLYKARLVMTQWVGHLGTFLLKSSNDKYMSA
jgi:hypothetical protein